MVRRRAPQMSAPKNEAGNFSKPLYAKGMGILPVAAHGVKWPAAAVPSSVAVSRRARHRDGRRRMPAAVAVTMGEESRGHHSAQAVARGDTYDHLCKWAATGAGMPLALSVMSLPLGQGQVC